MFVSVGFKVWSLWSPCSLCTVFYFLGSSHKKVVACKSLICHSCSIKQTFFSEYTAQIQHRFLEAVTNFVPSSLDFGFFSIPSCKCSRRSWRSEWSDIVFHTRAPAVQLAFLLPFKERAAEKRAVLIIGSCKALIIGEPLITGLCDR